MDTFNFLLALLMMMLAIQFGQNWIVAGIVLLLILTGKSIMDGVLVIVAAAALYFVGASDLNTFWPYVVFGLMILAVVIGQSNKPEQQPYDMLGGLGGYGGMGEGMM
ncbi:MAG: hypothetical protein V1494_00150 [Candidatus Diapherotrites archaeon]